MRTKTEDAISVLVSHDMYDAADALRGIYMGCKCDDCESPAGQAAELARLRAENAELKQRAADAERKIVDSNLKIGDAFSKGEAAIVEQMKALAAANKRIAELEETLRRRNDQLENLRPVVEAEIEALRPAATAWRELVELAGGGHFYLYQHSRNGGGWTCEFRSQIGFYRAGHGQTPAAALHAAWLRWQESKPKESEAADGE